jgi:NitT/TauT family transport system substrate-binding protein
MTAEGAKNVYAVLNAFDPTVKAAKINLAKTFDNGFTQKALAKYR